MHFLIVLVLAAVSAAHAEKLENTPKDILQNMIAAMEKADYQGTVVFLKNGKLEAMKYSHTVDKTGEHERLVSLNSPEREIEKKSDEVRCLFKATKRLIVNHRPYQHSLIVDVPKSLDELDGSYSFEIVGEENIAMMSAYIVAIQPKDEMRYLRKIWVTKAHFLPVKMAVYSVSGDILEEVLFTEIQVNHSILSANSAASQKITAASAHSEGLPEQGSFRVGHLPPGFKPVFFDRKPIHQSAQIVDHLILSDGFASVSVYLERETANADSTLNSAIPEGIHSVGAINSISRDLAESQITVLGEVPASTVKMIAEGITLHSESQK